jgi:hypothetical protein
VVAMVILAEGLTPAQTGDHDWAGSYSLSEVLEGIQGFRDVIYAAGGQPLRPFSGLPRAEGARDQYGPNQGP